MPFFDYIETYIEIYKRLFGNTSSSQLTEFKEFYNKSCKQYKGSARSGDTYIRQVYKSAVLLVFDRFGERGLNELYRDIYSILYYSRLTKSQIKYSTMTKKQNGGWLFSVIQHATKLSDLREIKSEAEKKAQEIRNILSEGKLPKFHVEEIEKAILRDTEK